jgi:tetratricopeptide (TPR) repeat protein
MMIVIRSCCFLAGLLVAARAAATPAAEPDGGSAEDAYGRGVHAYFSGNYLSGNSAAAEALFAEAMGHDPNDPRPHYFRALCLLRQGRSNEARSDFKIAAALEARSRGSYPVGKSLERVQGGERLMLEQFRWRAQADGAAAAGQDGHFDSNRRATLAMHTDVGVLRQKVSVPLDRLVQPVSLAELAELSADTDNAASSLADPFADDPRPTSAGKIPSGKLLGIFGRAIMHSAPVPSLDGLREQIPGLPLPNADDQSQAADAASDADADFAAGPEDPFSEPESSDTETESSDQPTDAAEEDPFG